MQAYIDLQKWCEENGMILHKAELVTSPNSAMMMMQSRELINPQEPFLAVPMNLVLAPSKVWRVKVLRNIVEQFPLLFNDSQAQKCSNYNKLLLLLLYEINKGPKSFYWPYIRQAIDDVKQNFPIKSEIDLIADPYLKELIQRQQVFEEKAWRTFHRILINLPEYFSLVTYDDFLNAKRVIDSRAFGSHVPELMLLPFVDLLNHSNEDNSSILVTNLNELITSKNSSQNSTNNNTRTNIISTHNITLKNLAMLGHCELDADSSNHSYPSGIPFAECANYREYFLEKWKALSEDSAFRNTRYNSLTRVDQISPCYRLTAEILIKYPNLPIKCNYIPVFELSEEEEEVAPFRSQKYQQTRQKAQKALKQKNLEMFFRFDDQLESVLGMKNRDVNLKQKQSSHLFYNQLAEFAITRKHQVVTRFFPSNFANRFSTKMSFLNSSDFHKTNSKSVIRTRDKLKLANKMSRNRNRYIVCFNDQLRVIPPKAELTISYGNHSNYELLKTYAFSISDNEFDRIDFLVKTGFFKGQVSLRNLINEFHKFIKEDCALIEKTLLCNEKVDFHECFRQLVLSKIQNNSQEGFLDDCIGYPCVRQMSDVAFFVDTKGNKLETHPKNIKYFSLYPKKACIELYEQILMIQPSLVQKDTLDRVYFTEGRFSWFIYLQIMGVHHRVVAKELSQYRKLMPKKGSFIWKCLAASETRFKIILHHIELAFFQIAMGYEASNKAELIGLMHKIQDAQLKGWFLELGLQSIQGP